MSLNVGVIHSILMLVPPHGSGGKARSSAAWPIPADSLDSSDPDSPTAYDYNVTVITVGLPLPVHALEVAAGARVDLDPFAFFDEERDVDGRARRELGGLRGAARRVALDAGLAFGDLQHDARGKLDSDRIAVVDRDFAVEPFAQKPDLIAHRVFHHVDLVARARIHEDKAIALVPRVTHLMSLDVGNLDRLARLPGALDDGPGREVFDATAGERLAFARLHELVLDDRVRHALDLNLQALANIGRLHGVAERPASTRAPRRATARRHLPARRTLAREIAAGTDDRGGGRAKLQRAAPSSMRSKEVVGRLRDSGALGLGPIEGKRGLAVVGALRGFEESESNARSGHCD